MPAATTTTTTRAYRHEDAHGEARRDVAARLALARERLCSSRRSEPMASSTRRRDDDEEERLDDDAFRARAYPPGYAPFNDDDDDDDERLALEARLEEVERRVADLRARERDEIANANKRAWAKPDPSRDDRDPYGTRAAEDAESDDVGAALLKAQKALEEARKARDDAEACAEAAARERLMREPLLHDGFGGASLGVGPLRRSRPMKRPRHQITNQSHHFPPHQDVLPAKTARGASLARYSARQGGGGGGGLSAAAIDERYGARRGGTGARSGHLDAFDGQGLGDVLKSAKKTKKPYGPGSSARFDDVGDDVENSPTGVLSERRKH